MQIQTPAIAGEQILVPAIPENTGISYLAEGGANIVYRISVPDPSPPPSVIEEYGDDTPPPTEINDVEEKIASVAALNVFDNKLLRARKDLPTTVSCAVSHANWLRLIVCLFEPAQLVQQCLVQLRPAKVTEHLNQKLLSWEHSSMKGSLSSPDIRPAKRHGVYLADDLYGLLITDMSPGHGDEVIQFKPKWLLQSPSAPAGAKRCRTCAKVARTAAKLARENPGATKKGFCPLDLVSENSRDISWVISQLGGNPSKALRLQRWLESNTLLKRLRDAQCNLDRKGTFETDPGDESFRLAMTLRDCSLYVRLPVDGKDDDKIEARIGDLDLKSPDKGDYWKTVERQLIDEGWYMGTEKKEDLQPLTCSLSPDRWSVIGKRPTI
ncbi:uncharacterized protein BP5553_04853 [Venustampulla echinocandica]|uniref:Inositol-pentakisphosphate 2-kinase n=1 Tax=Venustampulla echinocandica TaxID=2656787 RepID=A0A370TPG9_9HELO|nr:uncharacterized protein BP5553_04853 [Venustampulla echinocandica]RDL37420.1 hypothetical protein BP5553_04853 [Venustampulla echinocandica]